MRTIASQWDSYRATVIPKDAPPVQVTESRRAFYAGAQALLALQLAISEPGVSDDAGVQMMEGFHDECRRFGREVEAGRA